MNRSWLYPVFAGFALMCCAARAEIFIATDAQNSILVYDNFDAGLGVAPKRVIEGPDTQLDTVSGIVVYTGSEANSPTEIFACNRTSGQITVYPVDAEGNTPPTRSLLMADTSCFELAVYQDEIFTGFRNNGIFVYGAQQDGLALDPIRSIIFDTPIDSIEDLDVHNGELFVVIDVPNQPEEEIWVFDADASGVASEVVDRIISGDPVLDDVWRIDVAGDEIFLTVDSGPLPGDLLEVTVAVFDIEAGAAAQPIRKLHKADVVSEAVMVSNGDLYLMDIFNNKAIWVFDARAGGNVSEKRGISGDANSALRFGYDLFVTPDREPVDAAFGLALEEPLDGETHSGVGNLRGWSLASDGIEKVEIFIDGEFYQNAPYGGARGDVGGAFPDVDNGLYSGFSLAFNYSALDTGEHTITARAHTKTGRFRDSTATFSITKPGQEFIADPNGVDVSGAACSISDQNVVLKNISIDGGGPWDAIMKWRPAEQGFEVETYIFDNSSI